MTQENLTSGIDHRLAVQCIAAGSVRQYEVFPPGATIGAWHGADIQLQDEDIAPLQAAIRFDSVRSRWAVIRLSHDGQLLIDDTALSCGQAHPISGQASLHFSPDCQIAISEGLDALGVEPMLITQNVVTLPQTDAQPLLDETPQQEEKSATADLFSDLLGAGTVPVGAVPSLDTQHPFAMESAASRNSPDPLRQLKPKPELETHQNTDPLEYLGYESADSANSASLTDGSLSVLGTGTELSSTDSQPSILDSIGADYTAQQAAPQAENTRMDHRPVLNFPVRLRTPAASSAPPFSSSTPLKAQGPSVTKD